MFKFLNSKKGFSLTELMIVVVVLGVLTAIAIPSYNAVMASSKRKLCANQLLTIEKEVQNWCVKKNWTDAVSYKITKDTDGGGICGTYNTAGYTDGVDAGLAQWFEIEVHKNLQACPSGGTYYVELIPDNGRVITEVLVFCDCEDHNPDGHVPKTVE